MPALTPLEQSIRKEAAWLLREISTLQDFKSEVGDILQLKEKVAGLIKLASAKNAAERGKKNEQIQQEIKDLKRLHRSAGKDERRRIRFEKRVLGNIKSLQQKIDQPRQKELNDLVNKIHVYSGRILSEISLKAGKIANLVRNEDYASLEKHLAAITEAGTALLALLKHLDEMVLAIDSSLQKKQLTHGLLPSIGNFQGYIREGIIKTAHLKSVLLLQILLEKKMKKYRSWTPLGEKVAETYGRALTKNKEYLLKILTDEDIEQLRKITFPVPAGSVLLFLPKFSVPVLAFNLEHLPSFHQPGWLFHALPGENLARVSKTKLLQAPLETVIEKKHFYSWKFWENSAYPQRLIDGISLVFQDFVKYQDYLSGQERNRKRSGGKVGGFFIFPIRSVLEPGLILDFNKTMDGLPEVDLRDIRYHQYNPMLVRDCLVALREEIPRLLKILDEAWLLFQEAKQNISLFQELHEAIGKDVFVMMEKNKDGVLFFYLPRIMADPNQEIFTKKGAFYEKICATFSGFSRKNLVMAIEILTKDYFFEFWVWTAFHVPFDREKILPPLARFAVKDKPFGLDDTIFKSGMDFLNEEKLGGDKGPFFTSGCIILSMMKQEQKKRMYQTKYSTQDYLDEINKLQPKQLRKILERTMNELIHALDVIVKRRYRSSKPCVVDISKGVLFLNSGFSDDGVLKKLVADGIPIFSQFSSDGRIFSTSQLDFFFRAVLPLRNFPQTLKSSLWYSHLYLDERNRLTLQRDDEISYSSELKRYERIKRKPLTLD